MLASHAHTLRLSRRRLLAAVLAPTAVTLLAGCSSAVPSQPAPGGAVKPTASAPGVAPASGTLTLGVAVEPTTLDPQFANSVNEYMFTDNVMQGLLGFDQKVVVTPVLAESHTRIDDNTWEFKLRKGIKFHNGEPLTAEAVKVTFERTNDPNLKIRNTWYRNLNLDDIQVLDDLRLRFHTTTPTPQMLARLAKDYPIFPPKYLTQTDAKTVARKPIGTGPYMFKEWSSGEKIVLEANPDYWGTPKPASRRLSGAGFLNTHRDWPTFGPAQSM